MPAPDLPAPIPPAPASEPPDSPDRLVTLGSTEIRIRPLGVGTWAWGDRFTWGYGRGYGEADLAAAFRESLDAGVTLFDTAEIYGRGTSERLAGRFAREADTAAAGGDARPDPVIATKFFPFPWRLRRQSLIDALRGSLRRLGVERVDLYQIHWPYPPVRVERWAEALAAAVDLGLTRAVGVSNYSADQLRRTHDALAKLGVPLASNQVQYSLLHRRPEENGVLAACRERGVTLIAYSPLAMGILTGKYSAANPPRGLRRRRWHGARLARAEPLLAELRAIGAAHGKTPAQVALRWLVAQGAVPIPGAKNARQARENAGALGWTLTDVERARLAALSVSR